MKDFFSDSYSRILVFVVFFLVIFFSGFIYWASTWPESDWDNKEEVKTSEPQKLKVTDVCRYIADCGGSSGHQYEDWKVIKLEDGRIFRFNTTRTSVAEVANKITTGTEVSVEEKKGFFLGNHFIVKTPLGETGTHVEKMYEFEEETRTAETVISAVVVKGNFSWKESNDLLLTTDKKTYRLRLEMISTNDCWCLFLKQGDKIFTYVKEKGIIHPERLYVRMGGKSAYFNVL